MKRRLLALIILVGSFGWAQTSVLRYQGRILKPDATPLEAVSVQFRVQIRSPGTENCLLFEETRTLDMSGSSGIFSLAINDGTGTRNDSTGYTLGQILSNRASFSFANGECSLGATTYTPTSTARRNFILEFKESTSSSWETVTANVISASPIALESAQIGGYGSNQLCRVENAGVPQDVSALSLTQFNQLVSLANGTSSQYLLSTAPFSGDVSGSISATSVDKIKGQSVAAIATANQILGANSSGVGLEYKTLTAGSNVTITHGAGSVIIAASSSDSTKLSLAGGTMTGSVDMGTQNITNATSLAATNASVRNLIINDTGSNTVTLRAPTAVSTSYALTLPGDDGASGIVLTTDGSGILYWGTGGGGSGTVTSVGIAVPSFMTSSGGPVTSSGNVTLGFGSQAAKSVLAAPQGAAGSPTFRAMNISDIQSSVAGLFLTGAGCTAGQALVYVAASDTISCSSILPSVANSATLASTNLWVGDATNKAQAVTLSGDATLSNAGAMTIASNAITADKISNGVITAAKLDSSGANGELFIGNGSGFSKAALTAGSGVTITNSSGGITIAASGGSGTVTSVTSANSYLSIATTTSTPVITANVGSAANTLAAGDDSRITNSVQIGGNSTASALLIGTSSAQRFGLQASGSERLSILSGGNVGIRNTNPSAALDVNGSIKSALVGPLDSPFDLSLGNLQYTSSSCTGATWTLSNLQSGTTYTVVVQGNSHTGACVFSDSTSTFKYSPTNATPTATKDVIYTFLKVGSVVYVSWIDNW